MIYVKDTGASTGVPKENEILHTGSGGAFEEAERALDESEREMSDEQLDERLENTPEKSRSQRPSY
ncbi:hypothetical protein [Chitinophaga silvisoli]|uniref:Uncharacterized protein n=1 Tax=Chitinophaga silvisoli TaxID=2291814 RepID=A0A3E1NW99_9BACT|nr:hypothetical protein [Chitinophaga silvisoli]RFM32190.1 hypothetical protein DXN04_25760 [Chitinophaga silvisoli]